MRERERERVKYTCSVVNPMWNILFGILLSFQKKDKYGRAQHFLVGSPTIFIWLFYQTLSVSLSSYFVPGGVSQVLRKVTESVLSHKSALYYIHIHVLGVNGQFFGKNVKKKIYVFFFRKMNMTLNPVRNSRQIN